MQEVHVPPINSTEGPNQAQAETAYLYLGNDGLPRTCPVPAKPLRVEKANVTLDITPLSATNGASESEEAQPDAALTIRNFQDVEIGTITLSGLSDLDPSVLKNRPPHEWLMNKVTRLKTFQFTSDRTEERARLVKPEHFKALLLELQEKGVKPRSFLMENDAKIIAGHYANRLTRRIYRTTPVPKENPEQRITLIRCNGSEAKQLKDRDVRDPDSRLVHQPEEELCDLTAFSFTIDPYDQAVRTLQPENNSCLSWSVISETPTWGFMREFAKVYEIDKLTQRMIVQPQDKDAPFRKTGDFTYLRTYGSRISSRDSKLIEMAPVHFLIHRDGVVTFSDKAVNSFQAENWHLRENSSLPECVDVMELFGYIFDAVQESNAHTLEALSRQLGKFYAEDDRKHREDGITQIDTILASSQALRSTIRPSARIAMSLTASDFKNVSMTNKERVVARISDRISDLRSASITIRQDGKSLLDDIRTMHDQRTAKAAEAARKSSEFLDMCAKACLPFGGALGVFNWTPLADAVSQGTQDVIISTSLATSIFFVARYTMRWVKNEFFT